MYTKVSEIAARYRVSRDAVYFWIKNGTIPGSCIDRIGHVIRIRTADFEQLRREGKLFRPPKPRPLPSILAEANHTTYGGRDEAQVHRWTDDNGNVTREHPYQPKMERPT
jgi:hypothetical protein